MAEAAGQAFPGGAEREETPHPVSLVKDLVVVLVGDVAVDPAEVNLIHKEGINYVLESISVGR